MCVFALIYGFPFAAFKILEDERSQVIQGSKEGLPVIGFGKFLHEPLQVRVRGNHEGSDRNLQLLALGGQIKAAGRYFTVQAKTVFVVLAPDLQTSGFTIGNHEDLLIGISPSS
jgi:hypothetical protein